MAGEVYPVQSANTIGAITQPANGSTAANHQGIDIPTPQHQVSARNVSLPKTPLRCILIRVTEKDKLRLEHIEARLVSAVRKVIQQMLAGGHKFPLDFNLLAKLACKDSYGANHTEEQLLQVTGVAIHMCGRTRRMK